MFGKWIRYQRSTKVRISGKRNRPLRNQGRDNLSISSRTSVKALYEKWDSEQGFRTAGKSEKCDSHIGTVVLWHSKTIFTFVQIWHYAYL